MFGSRQSGVHAYAKVGIETGVAAASPHKLIVMLFDGALTALSTAMMNMRAGNIAAKGKAISQAIMIIDSGLRASLDKKAGGEIAEGLDALYEYMSERLLLANLRNQPEIIEEVQRLLTDLRDAWNAIGATPAGQAAEPSVNRAPTLASA
ncbi:MAG: flagellar export chaperone FliS [Pseudomonadota bacterium]